jgi:ADP-ribose pyrophosphatase YjhB (NUDIX family)
MLMSHKILNIVVAGIEYNNKWLFIKRKRGDYQKKWALVGGKMHFDETIRESVLREIKEETGLDVEWIGIKSILNERLKDKDSKEIKQQFIIFLCLVKSKSDEIQETEEGELCWFNHEDIEENKESIIPSDYYMITELIPRESLQQIIEVELLEKKEELSLGLLNEY